jgi:Flp pilus assembly protein TadG
MKRRSEISVNPGARFRAAVTSFLGDRGGGPAAEFALILVPMVFIFVLILQFGMLLFVHNDMFNAARDAARELAANELASVTSYGAATDCGSELVPSVEAVACSHLKLWSAITVFSVNINVTAGATDPSCDQVEIIVSTPMENAALFNIFGLLTGRDLIANMVIRSQHDIFDSGGNAQTGACIIET